MNGPITAGEIEMGIPLNYRQFFQVNPVLLPREIHPVIESFWEAVKHIGPAIWYSHPVKIIFSMNGFKISLKNCELVVNRKAEVINLHIDNIVFLNCTKMSKLRSQIQTACILEELVHALMHISDENLVSVVVASLYPGVVWVGGEYRAVEIYARK